MIAPIVVGGVVVVGAAGLTAFHAGPALAGISPIGYRLTPNLVGRGRAGHVALTFDDGPDPVSTPAILSALDDLGWKATFFMLGTKARRAPGLVGEIAAAGHEIAVHGDEHLNVLRRRPQAVRDDIQRALDTLTDLSGAVPMWFRPPFGILSGTALRKAKQVGLRTVLWTAWGRDWRKEATPESIRDDVVKRYLDGGTILLHDTDGESYQDSWRNTLGSLPLISQEITTRGLTVGPLRDHGINSEKNV